MSFLPTWNAQLFQSHPHFHQLGLLSFQRKTKETMSNMKMIKKVMNNRMNIETMTNRRTKEMMNNMKTTMKQWAIGGPKRRRTTWKLGRLVKSKKLPSSPPPLLLAPTITAIAMAIFTQTILMKQKPKKINNEQQEDQEDNEQHDGHKLNT